MENQLLSSMMYYTVFNLCFHYLQLLIKLGTVLSMIQNLTIPNSSLFFGGISDLHFLLLGLFSGLIHTERSILSVQ